MNTESTGSGNDRVRSPDRPDRLRLKNRVLIREPTLIATAPGTLSVYVRVIRGVNRSFLPQTTSHYPTSDKCDIDRARQHSSGYSA